MKKLIVFFIAILSVPIFSQISPTVFPKIGYTDLYCLQKARYTNYADSSYYYPRLHQLGLNYVSSYTDNNSKTPALNNNIKILDFAFGRGSTDSYNNPFKFANATGDNVNHFPYEAGGSNIAILTTQSHNFGFGNASGNSSWWIYPYDGECIGNTSYPDPQHTGTVVHFAQVGVHSNGILLKAKPDATHFPYDDRWGHIYDLRLRILARRDGDPGTVNVARVHVWEQMPSMLAGTGTSAGISSNEGIQNLLMKSQTGKTSTTNMSILTLTDYTYYITANDFNGTNYKELISPSTFRKTVDTNPGPPSELYVTIEWLGTRNLYVDKIAIYSTYYDELFIANSTTVRNTIKSDLEGIFGSVKTHSAFAHPYYDEPYPMMYRAVGEVSNLSETQLGTGKYVNGATGGKPVDMLMLANSQRRVPYVLYDLYPITPNYDSASTGTNSIQGAWDYLINSSEGNVGYGVERYKGIKQAIRMAENYTPDNTSDDVPFYHTIQVQAEKFVSSGIVQSVRFREPRYYEILAQGNLALCYGAKGIMYFLIMTNALYTSSSEPNYYGLFEESGNIGGIVQNPFNPQVSNYRFNAVQKLNQYIDKISSEVLLLTWRAGYSILQGQPSGTYISNISSATTGGTTDASGSTYVELGTFKKTSDFSNTNLEYFMVVNRRVLSSEPRKITVTFNKSSSYTTWKIREVGTNNYWVVSNTGSFQATYTPGEGKLFKFEPLFLNSTEIFSGATVIVNNSITVPSGKTLSISGSSSLYFGNSISLIVNGTLNANGSSASTPITFNRSGASGTWGGIQLNSGSSGSTVSYSIIRNAERGIYENGVSVNVTNSAISNCTYGLYLYNSSPTNVQLNNFHNNSYAIYLTSSSPYLYNNYIQNNSLHGVYCTTSSNPKFGNGNTQGKNNLTGNSYGVFCWNNSYPMLGKNSPVDGGYNNLVNTLYNVYCMSSGGIYAINNWWGSTVPANFKIAGTGNVVYYPYLSSIVSIPTPPLSKTSGNIYASEGGDIPLLSELDKANELIASNNLEEARKICLNLVTNYPDYSVSYNALNLLKDTYPANDISSTKDIYKSLFNTKGKKDLYAMAGLILSDIDKENRLKQIDEVINNYKGESVVELALFDKFVYYYFELNDRENALAMSKELDGLFPLSQGSIEAHRILGDKEYYDINVNPGQALQKTSVQIPAEYALLGNYPNPFNPTTTISYTLPEDGKVQIKVFDVLGRELTILVNEFTTAGKHNVVWDGDNFASGIYFYSITFKNQTLYKKMLLMK